MKKQKIILLSLNIIFILIADKGYSESIREKLKKARLHEQEMRISTEAKMKKIDNTESADVNKKLKRSKKILLQVKLQS